MLLKKYSKQSRSINRIIGSFPHVQSSIKLDSFLNFSKVSDESKSSIHKDISEYKPIKKTKSKCSSLPKQKTKNNKFKAEDKTFHKHSCCMDDLTKTLNKNKSALSQYILKNTSSDNDYYFPNIKLLGNSRYKYTNPLMFVEDQKNNMSDLNLGLMPIPMERCKIIMDKNNENEIEKKLFELQRSIVMLRRRQYNKNNQIRKGRNQFIDYNTNSYINEADDISEYINKIVLIQKWWLNYSKANLTKIKMIKFEKKIKSFINKIVIKELKKLIINYKRPLNLICYIYKTRFKHDYTKLNNEYIKNGNGLDYNKEVYNKNITNLFNKKCDKDINKENGAEVYNNNYINNNNNEIKKDFINNNNNLYNNIIKEVKVFHINKEKKLKTNNIEVKESNLRQKKYNLEIFIQLSNIIKNIFKNKLIQKIIINDNLPAINIPKLKLCSIYKIRKKIIKKEINIKNEIVKIERINYINDILYQKPLFNKKNNKYKYNFSGYQNNCLDRCYITKIRLGPKIEAFKNILKSNKNMIKNDLNAYNEKYLLLNKKSFDNILHIRKNTISKYFFLSKKNIKQEINNIIKIQNFVRKKNNEKRYKNKSEIKDINLIINKVYKKNPEEICYIDKIRKNDYLKNINCIRIGFKSYSKNKLKKIKNKEIIYKRPLNQFEMIIKKRYFIFNKKVNDNKNNLYYFILLIHLFLTKNIQEYIFPIIKQRKVNSYKNNYYYPFYIKAIKKMINYLQKSIEPNKKISLFFEEIFQFKQSKEKNILNKLCFLEEKNKNKLINTNIFASSEEKDLINYLCDFSEFDKNIKNEKFIAERLKQTKLNNTNIFTLIKLIDFEYNSFVEGIYCYKCYNELSKCKCIESKDKNNISNDYSSQNNKSKDNYKSEDNLTIDELDFNSNSTINNRQINYFGYNIEETKKDNNILIKTKTMNNENNNQKLLDIILPEK